MALGDLLQLLQMPQPAAAPSVMSGAPVNSFGVQPSGLESYLTPTSTTQPLTPTDTSAVTPTQPGGVASDPNFLLGHHVNNLLQVTGNLQPPPGTQTSVDQTQANIPGGAMPNAPVAADGSVAPNPNATDPNYNRDHVNGPFKLHGVAGDILGHLMDAVLVGAGLHAEYGPRVQAAKEADAIANAQGNDAQAYQNLVRTGGLTEANQYQTGLDDKVKAQAEVAKNQIAAAQAKLVQQGLQQKADENRRSLASQFAGMSDAELKDPKNIALAKQVAAAVNADKAKWGDTSSISDDPESLRNYAAGGITPDQQVKSRIQQAHDAATEAEEHARTGIEAGRLAVDQANSSIHAGEASVSEANMRDEMAHRGQTKAPTAQQIQAAEDKHNAAVLHAQVFARNNGAALPASHPIATIAAVPPGAAAKLQANPSLRGAFDAKYGKGAAAHILGN